ncbi:MAG TPA: type II secretion system protein [Chthoniobacteraceae bacterium]|nr:type II secretion system protein [Chthoniobacteraceae bacterium]
MKKLLTCRAFSLLELLLAITVVAVIALFGFSGFRHLRERTADAQCVTNLRQLGAATLAYVADHRGELPYYYYQNDLGGAGSGTLTGTWYYNLAPYVGVPRVEGLDPVRASSERVRLGTPEERIGAPCVFTCPAHRTDESTRLWLPHPMTFPSQCPVSYAPSLKLRQTERAVIYPDGTPVYPNRLADIPYPASKAWLMDAPMPSQLNVTPERWKPREEYEENWPRQAFTRHHGGGNILFFDGHIQWLPLETFIQPANGSLPKTVNLYFDPWRDPVLDR